LGSPNHRDPRAARRDELSSGKARATSSAAVMSNERRNALTPEALGMVDAIARSGSFAAAARELGKVPSALTYSVRQLEDALDVLLFDRSSRQAKLTAAGEELLEHGRRVLGEVDALANRVQRVATGWEASLTIAADGVVSRLTLFELIESFYAQRGAGASTQLRVRTEVLTGVWEALLTGHADLAIGLTGDTGAHVGIEVRPLGEVPFVFAVAPHHPLAALPDPLADDEIQRHRAVAVADSAQRLAPATHNLLGGQDVLTVASMQAKIEAQVRCLGCGFIPEPLARTHIRNGVLAVKRVQRGNPQVRMSYAWRADAVGQPHRAPQGLALQWWLRQLDSSATRQALLEHHRHTTADVD
jgi:DNA-binding transcriptional LysR family regulator